MFNSFICFSVAYLDQMGNITVKQKVKVLDHRSLFSYSITNAIDDGSEDVFDQNSKKESKQS